MTGPLRVGPVGDTVRQNIRRLRESRGHSLRTLSAELKTAGHQLSGDAILKAEQGLRRLDADDLAAFATALGVALAQLFEPPTDCTSCHGTPPPGFTCRSCGAEA
ncbi:helix-turn-helix domain-containing protein [Streptomyces aquilus]|uniref:helix-turn-helix domain-containing protein n=1 Tax=Streptomyces aquilus TaxID=2548456 RepID=UPI0037CFDA7A